MTSHNDEITQSTTHGTLIQPEHEDMKMNMMVLFFLTCDIDVSKQHVQDMRAGVTQRNVHEWHYIIQCYDSA